MITPIATDPERPSLVLGIPMVGVTGVLLAWYPSGLSRVPGHGEEVGELNFGLEVEVNRLSRVG